MKRKTTKIKDNKLPEVKEEKKLSIFDILENLSYQKTDRWYELKTVYNAYMVNKFLSMSQDTVHFANAMNKSNLEPEMQYKFYLHVLPRKKRFFQYVSKKKDDDIEFVAQHFNINMEKARQYMSFITDEGLKNLKAEYDKGGIS